MLGNVYTKFLKRKEKKGKLFCSQTCVFVSLEHDDDGGFGTHNRRTILFQNRCYEEFS